MAATPLPATGRAFAPSRRRATAPAPRRAEPASRPARRLQAVPAARPRRQVLPTWAYGTLAGTILALGVLGIVALNALAAEASFEARSLESEISDLTLRHDDLVAAVSTLAAPARVREVATNQLGLIEPEQPGFLTLHPDHLLPPTPKPPVRLGE